MMPDLSPTEWAFVGGNVLVALAYLAIAATRVPAFAMRSRPGRHKAIVIGAGLFFVLCSWTHWELAAHTLLGDSPGWFLDPHMWAQHLVQGVAGMTFWVATRNARIVVHPREIHEEIERKLREGA